MPREPTEKEIFEVCLALDSGERSRVIGRYCSGNPRLADRVHRLLEAHHRAEEVHLPHVIPEPDEDPRQIGPYELLRVLGEGGMGVVYEAQQRFPVRRKVALKLVRRGFDTRQVVARFETERQSLAVMDHPNIAKVLDAGADLDGRPYFVMELVDGVPITRFCDRDRFSLRKRLELFATLCGAVQHAHRKGVIHRDLKPSNVLVVMRQGVPEPKVIDFGIAKAVGWRHPEGNTFVTQAGTALGTPAYMSPEQAERSGMFVDTRSDVYSLGVMLYEILAGKLPYDVQSIGIHAFVAKLVDGKVETPLPSCRVAELGDRAEEIASTRGSNARALVKELKGDLDRIVMKAVDRDRSQRYDSAATLGRDIQRYLDDEPVLARSPTLIYRARKFCRRRRSSLIAASLVLAAVLIGIIGIIVGLVEADQARVEAERQAIKARAAERDANLRLRNALLAHVTALRRSRAPGRRRHGLELLAQAAAIRPGGDIRDEAIACATLTDLEELARWPWVRGEAVSVSFAGDLDRFAAGFRSGKVEIRRAISGELIGDLPAGGGVPVLLRFGPGGQYLAVKYLGDGAPEDSRVVVWDVWSRRPVFELPILVAGASIDFSRDFRHFALGTEDGRLLIGDMGGRQVLLRTDLKEIPTQVRFSPDGSLIAVALRKGGVQVRDTTTGELAASLDRGEVAYAVDWNGEGSLLVVGYADARAAVWSLEESRVVATLLGHQSEVVRTWFHPSHPLVLTYSWDETSRLWNAWTGEQLLILRQQTLGMSSDGELVSFAGNDELGLSKLLYGDTFKTLFGHQGKGPHCVSGSRDGRFIASGGNDGILIWALEHDRPVVRIPAGVVKDLFFAGGDRHLISCGSQGLVQWTLPLEPGEPQVVRKETLESVPCGYAALDPTGRFITSFHDGQRAYVREFGAVGVRSSLAGFPGMAHVSVAPGARLVAAGNWRGNQTVVWNGMTGEVVKTLLPGRWSVAASFSPDGQMLVTGSSEDYRFWRTDSWEEILRVKRPDRFSNLPGKIAFSEDPDLLALVMDQQRIRLLDRHGLETVAEFELLEPQSFTGIAFGVGGRRLVASTAANRIHIWNLAPVANELARFSLGLDFGRRDKAGGLRETANPSGRRLRGFGSPREGRADPPDGPIAAVREVRDVQPKAPLSE